MQPGTLQPSRWNQRITAFLLATLLLASSVRAAQITVVQLERFDQLHNGSIDVDIGIGHNLRQDALVLCNLRLDGPIEAGDLGRLKQVIDAQLARSPDKPPRLCLNSPGGSYDEGLGIARYLMDSSIGTGIEAGRSCYSACAIVFMAGTFAWKGELNRYLHTQAVLGFHAPYIPDRNDQSKVVVDEKEVQLAFSDGIRAISAFMRLGVGNAVKRIVPELMQEMIDQGPREFFYVDTIGKAIRFRIHLYGIDRPPPVDEAGICNACVNMNYFAREQYADGGRNDLCKGSVPHKRAPFPKGVRLTNLIAPRGGECAVDVLQQAGRVTGWRFRNDERAGFGDGLELAYWYLLSPSTKLATLSKPQLTPASQTGEISSSERERLRSELLNFVAIEYLGHGLPDHRDRPELFAPRVKYYKQGVISREAVLTAKAGYYKRWPQRRYELVKDSIKPAPGPDDTILVTFRYSFEVSDAKETRRGIGVARLGIALTGNTFSIVSEDGEVERRF